MAKHCSLAAWAVCLGLLLALQLSSAGLIIENDGSDLCNSNLQDCTSRCAPPQSFVFSCNSGGTFSKPQSDCKCTSPPAPHVVTDGSAVMQLVQWPGPQACGSETWLYDCAQFIKVQSMMNNIQATPVDQASAMAAVAAAQAAAQAAAAQAAAQAAAAAAATQQQQQNDPSGLNTQPSAPGLTFGAQPAAGASQGMSFPAGNAGGSALGGVGMGNSYPATSSADGINMGGAAYGTGGMGSGMATGMGNSMGSGMANNNMGAGGMGSPGMGLPPDMGNTAMAPTSGLMGGAMPGMGSAPFGAAPMGSTPGSVGNSLMEGQFGHRHLLQAGVLGASPAAPTSGAMPTTTLPASCNKQIQGLVTGPNTGLMAIPSFKGVANMLTRNNSTMFVQLTNNCIGAYKLMTGEIMDIGRPAPDSGVAPAPAATKSNAGALAIYTSAAMSVLLAALLASL